MEILEMKNSNRADEIFYMLHFQISENEIQLLFSSLFYTSANIRTQTDLTYQVF